MAHLNAISFPSIEELREYAIHPAIKFACTSRYRIKETRVQVPEDSRGKRLSFERVSYFPYRYTDRIYFPSLVIEDLQASNHSELKLICIPSLFTPFLFEMFEKTFSSLFYANIWTNVSL